MVLNSDCSTVHKSGGFWHQTCQHSSQPRSLSWSYSLSNRKSPPFVVSAILNFIGLVQYATICLKMSPKKCCVHLFFQDYIIAIHFRWAVLSIFFLNSKKYRIMLQDSLSEQPDLPTSLLYFIFFTGYLLHRGLTTNCPCFALRSCLIRLPSTFQNFFTFTLLPSSSALLQTPKCSEYNPYQASVIWNQLPVSVHHSTSVSSFKSSLKTFLFFLWSHCPDVRLVCVWARTRMQICVCVCMCVHSCCMCWILTICICKERVRA